jgi:hypothetical protein
MRRRRLLVLASACCAAATAGVSRAQQPAVLDTLQKASVAALSWFRSLMEPISLLVAAEERNQLLESLSQLSIDLYAIEQDKQVLVQLLKRNLVDQAALSMRAERLRVSIERARDSLRRLGPLLRLRYKDGGEQVDALLADAAVARKYWVEQYFFVPLDSSRRQNAIAEGEQAISALRAANVELAKLIQRL